MINYLVRYKDECNSNIDDKYCDFSLSALKNEGIDRIILIDQNLISGGIAKFKLINGEIAISYYDGRLLFSGNGNFRVDVHDANCLHTESMDVMPNHNIFLNEKLQPDLLGLVFEYLGLAYPYVTCIYEVKSIFNWEDVQ